MKTEIDDFKETFAAFMDDAYLHFPPNTDERMGLFLSLLGNRAAQILLGHVLSRLPKSRHLVQQLVFEETGQLLETDDITLRFLAPTRLAEVKFPKVGNFENISYVLSFEGARYGTPAACFTMDYESKSGIKIAGVFGESSKAMNRVPHNRFRILKVLYESDGPKRKSNLRYDSKLSDYRFETGLKALLLGGFVKTDAIEIDEWIPTHVKWIGKELPKNEKERKLARLVKSDGETRTTDVATQSGYSREEAYKILDNLEDRGLVTYHRAHIDKKVEVTITDKGKEIVDNYCRPLYMHLSGVQRFPVYRDHEERVRLYSERTLDRLIRERANTTEQRLAINELRASQMK